MMKRATFGALALTAGLSAGVFVSAQQTPQRPPVFRSATELVEIDVVVVDKAGQRVHGLTKDDFVLKDRKKLQPIEAFTEVRRDVERVVDRTPLPAETRVDVASNTSAQSGRLVVLVLDDLHVWKGRAETVKEIARKIVTDLGPESSMALIQTGGEHGVEVTNDRSRLLAGVDKFIGRRPVRRPLEVCDPIGKPGPIETADASTVATGCEIQELNANRGLIRALEDAARILGRGDKRRKAFILVSENIAKDISGLFDGGEQIANIVSRSPDLVAAPAYEYQMLNTMNAMRRGNVATYSIDPRGLITPQKLMEECFPPPRGERGIGADPCTGDEASMRDAAGEPTGYVRTPTNWNAWVRKAQQGLEIMSEETGGFAVVNTDDFTGGIREIIRDLDNYYLLGFYPPDLQAKGYRQIEVEVKGRPDLKLRYRQGYQIEGAPPPEKETDELSRLIGGALPTNDLPLRLTAVPMPGVVMGTLASTTAAPSRDARVFISLELTVPTQSMRTADTDRLLDDIRYGVFAVDLKGAKIRERKGSGAKVALRPRPGLVAVPDKVTYQIVSEMSLPPGQYQLRASATSDKLSAGGSVYLSFDVPDFSKADLQLTDLVLAYADGPHVPIARDVPKPPSDATRPTSARAPSAAQTSMLRSVGIAPEPAASTTAGTSLAPLPFEPTLDRVFTSRDTLRLYFKAVQRRLDPLTATISALTPDGDVVVTFDRALAAERQPSLDIQLPLAQLIPGAYRLQVRVSDGAMSDLREIGFVVK